jgi:chemotaxis protein MotB
VASLTERLGEAETERDDAASRAEVLTAERDAARTERDALRSERDALTERTTELRGTLAETEARVAALLAAQTALEAELRGDIDAGDITVENRGGRLAVLLADQVLFPSGSAELSAHGREVLGHVATSLRSLEDRRIIVEGHTDSTPLTGESLARFGSNWELSTTRATSVVRYFAETAGVPGERMVASGYGEFHPVDDNATPRGRRRNRRIEITLAPE